MNGFKDILVRTGRSVMLIWSCWWRLWLPFSDPLTTIDAVPANSDEQWVCASLCSLLVDPWDEARLLSWGLLATETDILIYTNFVFRRLHFESFYELGMARTRNARFGDVALLMHWWWPCMHGNDDVIAQEVRMRTSFPIFVIELRDRPPAW